MSTVIITIQKKMSVSIHPIKASKVQAKQNGKFWIHSESAHAVYADRSPWAEKSTDRTLL